MMYSLKVAPPARKRLKHIQKLYEEEVVAALKEFKEDPFSGKSLIEDLTGERSYRIDVYRIIYTVNDKDKIVYILSARHRSISYQR